VHEAFGVDDGDIAADELGPAGRRDASLSCFHADAPVVLSSAWIAPLSSVTKRYLSSAARP
jgi:hypothetical protein